MEKATENFIERGEQIANENPDIKVEMLTAVEEVRKTGEIMRTAAREFSEDPCSSLRRGNMVRAARNLLSAVTRLLVLADMVDVHLLLKSLHVVQDDLNKLRNASSQDELLNNMRVSKCLSIALLSFSLSGFISIVFLLWFCLIWCGTNSILLFSTAIWTKCQRID